MFLYNTFRKIKKIAVIYLVCLMVLQPVVIVVAQAPSAPTAPSAPSAPTAPSAPSAPTAPEAPSTQSAPSAPVKPQEPQAPSVAPTKPPAPSRPASPTPTVAPQEKNSSVDATVTTVTPTLIQENSASNSNTGPSSTNESVVKNEQRTDILNRNTAESANRIDINASTGNNVAGYTTEGANIKTGDVNISFNLINKLNSNITGQGSFVNIDIGEYYQNLVLDYAAGALATTFENAQKLNNSFQTIENQAQNMLTGPNSQNKTVVSDADFKVIENNNDTQISNDINVNALTGGNINTMNTGVAQIDTGDINVLGNLINLANTNINVSKWLIGVVNIFGKMVGDIVLPRDDGSNASNTQPQSFTTADNKVTGPGSENFVEVKNEENKEIYNQNTANINNQVNVAAVTGGNTTADTTGATTVTTGEANVSVEQKNLTNINSEGQDTVWIVLVNKLGEWIGYIVGGNQLGSSGSSVDNLSNKNEAGNTLTGPNSTNDVQVENVNNEATINNNKSEITNDINVNAQSGSNIASMNTLGAQINTGDVDVGLSLLNLSNLNITANKLAILIVDVFGDWIGRVIPPNEDVPQTPLAQDLGFDSFNAPKVGGFSTPSDSNTKVTDDKKDNDRQKETKDNANNNQSNNSEKENNKSQSSIALGQQEVEFAASDFNQDENSLHVDNSGNNPRTNIFSRILGKDNNQPSPTPSVYYQTYQDYLALQDSSLNRGVFTSPTFAKEVMVMGSLFGGRDIVDINWLLILIPLWFATLYIKRKFINKIPPARHYYK